MDANIPSVLLIFVDNTFEVVATDTVVLIPDNETNPIDCVPIPVRCIVVFQF